MNRIELNKPDEKDFEGLIKLWTDQQVRQYLGGPVSLERAQETAARIIGGAADAPSWVIRNRSTNEFVGLISLDEHHDKADTEVSFQLLPDFQGQGLASEALDWVLDYAKTSVGLTRIVAETQVQNERSRNLLERHGFHVEKLLTRFDARQALYVRDLSA